MTDTRENCGREHRDEAAALRAELAAARDHQAVAMRGSHALQQRAERAEAERDAMRAVVEAAESYADQFPGLWKLREAVDAYRAVTGR